MEQFFDFGKGLKVNRLGYGTMQLPGKGVWGPAKDVENAVEVVTTVIDNGVDFIDTADSYGPFFANLYLKEALKQRPGNNVMVATKVGFTRQGPGQWTPNGRPDYLRQQVELNLFSLGLKQIDLLQLHRIDKTVPLEEQLGVLKELQSEGKIKHIGLSQVSVPEIEAAQKIVPIVSVQNRYNLIDRADEDVLEFAEKNHLAFIPWFPLATGKLSEDKRLLKIADKYDASPSQIALAWLLKKSAVIMPIPGTKSKEHAVQNLEAAKIELTDAEFNELGNLK
ncbi:aldo/keto reductase [Liquorilactobacillus mali]|uniref:Aryl-alcohol dehydrogenase related enzyme n=1 Tax=Liquorilactobacillus mali KCTC 3596 = DSM 20444 TaxID=1046596 RepID=J1F0N1_9LACO|nr:aldo/keto reductase [Liquorilactobacillus mali]EJE97529.1 Aryl-alcohol dehydrogenase related enzyme [Liquorilactobacillus mali KCTC 3596 = DSM 20444]KRN11227.1 Aryl-alcohol dehydrogenase related enzyme [Liquorilactobacillus mali KCTC 3596 = DSM 20444]MDC7954128.1 aldo/keto reductase [Liquorilactobacillus mali]MDV7757709.1 aldo/keto reductase [Liquorilactobacillus mali]QFQ73781.1 aldo/keto reductase [Liquorilactobacillus mali]